MIFIIAVATHTRLILENVSRYGLLVSLPTASTLSVPAAAPLLAAAALSLPLLFAWAIERWAISLQLRPRRLWAVDAAHATNAVVCLLLPCYLVVFDAGGGGTAGGVALLLAAVTLFMKLVSWAHVHHDLRLAHRESNNVDGADAASLAAKLAKFSADVADTDVAPGGRKHYPHSVTLGAVLYFAFAPTLCYQESFPRTPRVRPAYVLSLLLRLLLLVVFIPAFVAQYIHPLLQNATAALDTRDATKIVERLLKLALPVTYVWLAGFYLFFHVWLNLLAELLRFGDRLFYKPWWNATNFEAYWRLWNIPVHHWIVRHCYFPCLRHVTSNKAVVGLLCFTLSAVLHELIVALPLHSYRMPLAFLAMMAQVPLLFISLKVEQLTKDTSFSQLGNYLFWVCFCFLGQPAAVMLYFYRPDR